MGKLAVAFFAVLAVQAVFGEHTLTYGYGREDVNSMVGEVVTLSNRVYENLYNAPLRRGFSWENRMFGEQIEEIINYLEELTTKHVGPTNEIIVDILRELRQVHYYFNELYTCRDATIMRKLEVAFAHAIKKVCRFLETFVEIHYQGQLSGTFYSQFRTILVKYMYILKSLCENVNTYSMYNTNKHYMNVDDELTPEYYGKQHGYYGMRPYNYNKFTSKYDETYYGPLTKYFNKYNKNFYGGEYEPTFNFRGLLNRNYNGVFDRENTFEGRLWNTNKFDSDRYNYEWYFGRGQNWEGMPYNTEYKYGPKSYNTEWKHGQNWENIPETYKNYVYKYETPEQYRYGNWEHNYETPKYFAKYTHANEYVTKDLKVFFNHIKNVVLEVTEELKQVTYNKQYLTVYVRELIQFVDFVINRFEQENIRDYKFNEIVKSFYHIKEELKRCIYEPTQVNYYLATTIEKIFYHLEELIHCEQYNQIQLVKDIFVQYFNYVRNVQYHIKNTVYGTGLEGLKTEWNVNNEKPFVYALNVLGVMPRGVRGLETEY